MEVIKYVLYMTVILWSSSVSTQDTQELTVEITTEHLDFSSGETTEAVSESPDSENIPEGEKLHDPPSGVEGKEEEPFAVEERPVVVSFPDNHKNFTPSQYLVEEDFPPYYNHLNPYQYQYKNYVEQKKIYSTKPVKFEEDSLNNFYLPSEANLPDLRDEKKNEDGQLNRKPFPYVFENEREQDKSNWYTTTGHVLVQEHPANEEHAFRGHQENIIPYYIFPHSYPQREEGEFHKNEFVHFDHPHVKKYEKENPWKKVFHVLTALVPLGLLLATLTPNVISINSSAATKTTRQRSEDSSPWRFKEEDVFKLMRKYGVESLSEEECEDKIICELALEGGKNTAGPIEKGFWFLANQTPWDTAEKAGMNELFQAIKTGNCEAYKCEATNKRSLEKKLTKKRKITS